MAAQIWNSYMESKSHVDVRRTLIDEELDFLLPLFKWFEGVFMRPLGEIPYTRSRRAELSFNDIDKLSHWGYTYTTVQNECSNDSDNHSPCSDSLYVTFEKEEAISLANDSQPFEFLSSIQAALKKLRATEQVCFASRLYHLDLLTFVSFAILNVYFDKELYATPFCGDAGADAQENLELLEKAVRRTEIILQALLSQSRDWNRCRKYAMLAKNKVSPANKKIVYKLKRSQSLELEYERYESDYSQKIFNTLVSNFATRGRDIRLIGAQGVSFYWPSNIDEVLTDKVTYAEWNSLPVVHFKRPEQQNALLKAVRDYSSPLFAVGGAKPTSRVLKYTLPQFINRLEELYADPTHGVIVDGPRDILEHVYGHLTTLNSTGSDIEVYHRGVSNDSCCVALLNEDAVAVIVDELRDTELLFWTSLSNSRADLKVVMLGSVLSRIVQCVKLEFTQKYRYDACTFDSPMKPTTYEDYITMVDKLLLNSTWLNSYLSCFREAYGHKGVVRFFLLEDLDSSTNYSDQLLHHIENIIYAAVAQALSIPCYRLKRD